jgi:NAD(P)H-flavin reductase
MSKTISELTREEKDFLKNLSREVFGASSRWQKLVERGYEDLVTEETTEYVPNDKDPDAEGTTRQVNVPVLKNGMKHSVIKRHTVDSIRQYMIDRKAMLDKIRAMMEEQRKAQLAKEDFQKRVQGEGAGSALTP